MDKAKWYVLFTERKKQTCYLENMTDCEMRKHLKRVLTIYSCSDQLLCITSSFLKKPISPPSPAISVVNRIRLPVTGNMGQSLLSFVQMYLSADFKFGPHCSRTRKAACFEHVIFLNAASYCILCFEVPVGFSSMSSSSPLSFCLKPDHGKSCVVLNTVPVNL